MRIYLPATLSMLFELNQSGEFRPVGGTAFALTPALREAYHDGDDEELAEAAIREAARASLRLLAAEDDDRSDEDGQAQLPARRVVIAADVDEVKLRPDLDVAVVKVPPVVDRSAIASVLIDGGDAEGKVVRAVGMVDSADLGDEDSELAIGDVEDFDLGWYATQELPFLLELL
ncbi:DUF6912 family protein [Williamsia muralis]|uniref:Uncharacterized protein n=1 Tax=Williamsia marianensis TaxID=85044 RepID=A0A2G3PIM6_WILMA|nr:hypothetical protein [Williamsia marianensis]PHV65674.1 hypothetical protein CSW57_18230 [Williamsia marianensis]PZT99387.1 MAG: hypothetical protein DI630_17055 [Gordonia sp. (in: high G+C Gram-positive bacteria)]